MRILWLPLIALLCSGCTSNRVFVDDRNVYHYVRFVQHQFTIKHQVTFRLHDPLAGTHRVPEDVDLIECFYYGSGRESVPVPRPPPVLSGFIFTRESGKVSSTITELLNGVTVPTFMIHHQTEFSVDPNLPDTPQN